MERHYTAHIQPLNVYVYTKKQLEGCSFYIGYKGHDVLATDGTRGIWYYTLDQHDDKYYYGPYKSAQEARRGYDDHIEFES